MNDLRPVLPDEGELFFARHGFNCGFASHCGRGIGTGFRIGQPHRSAGSSVAGSGAIVMLPESPVWIIRPARIQSSVGAFDNIAEEGHPRIIRREKSAVKVVQVDV